MFSAQQSLSKFSSLLKTFLHLSKFFLIMMQIVLLRSFDSFLDQKIYQGVNYLKDEIINIWIHRRTLQHIFYHHHHVVVDLPRKKNYMNFALNQKMLRSLISVLQVASLWCSQDDIHELYVYIQSTTKKRKNCERDF